MCMCVRKRIRERERTKELASETEKEIIGHYLLYTNVKMIEVDEINY